MPRRLLATTAAALSCLVLTATAAAQTAEYDSPLLSGYGDVGAAEQAIFGGQGLGGGSGSGGDAGAATAAAAAAASGELDLRAQEALRGAPRRDRAPSGGAGSGAAAAPADPTAGLPALRGPLAAGAGDPASPLGGWDLILGIACALALALCALATRRQTFGPVGR